MISAELQSIVTQDMSAAEFQLAPMTSIDVMHHRVGANICVRKEYRMLTLAEREGIKRRTIITILNDSM